MGNKAYYDIRKEIENLCAINSNDSRSNLNHNAFCEEMCVDVNISKTIDQPVFQDQFSNDNSNYFEFEENISLYSNEEELFEEFDSNDEKVFEEFRGATILAEIL